jgi:hypothetical protein
MSRVTAVLRGFGAILVSAIISTIGFVLLGVFLPVWAMILIYGRQNLQDAPAHGGVIFLATVPIAGALALCGFLVLRPRVYRRLSRYRGD